MFPRLEDIDSHGVVEWTSTVTFVADGETYHYVTRGLYVAAGGGGYVTSEPALGSVCEKLPDGATVINGDDKTYFQFDTVFFEPEGSTYVVIAAPDGSEIVEEDTEES
jgi:hypothetical protein